MASMKIELNHVSVSEDGDERFQVRFGSEPDSSETGMYVVIQRDFEEPDDGRCYIETHDDAYVGHFRVVEAEVGKRRVRMRLARKQADELEVTFEASDADYRELVRVLRIMIPRLKVVDATEG
jgi:hypothetical protein